MYSVSETIEHEDFLVTCHPRIWIQQNKLMWPPLGSGIDRKTIVLPGPDWTPYTYRILKDNIDTFEEALKLEEMYSMHSDSNSFREENDRKKYRREHPVNANLSLIDVNDMIKKIDTENEPKSTKLNVGDGASSKQVGKYHSQCLQKLKTRSLKKTVVRGPKKADLSKPKKNLILNSASKSEHSKTIQAPRYINYLKSGKTSTVPSATITKKNHFKRNDVPFDGTSDGNKPCYTNYLKSGMTSTAPSSTITKNEQLKRDGLSLEETSYGNELHERGKGQHSLDQPEVLDETVPYVRRGEEQFSLFSSREFDDGKIDDQFSSTPLEIHSNAKNGLLSRRNEYDTERDYAKTDKATIKPTIIEDILIRQGVSSPKHRSAAFEETVLKSLHELKNAQKKSEERHMLFEARMIIKYDTFVNEVLKTQGQSQERRQNLEPVRQEIRSKDLAPPVEEDFDDFDDFDVNFPIKVKPGVEALEWNIRTDLEFKFSLPAGGYEDSDEDEGYSMASIKKTCENMKITVLPDITENAGLNGHKFDATLEPEVRIWFQQIETTWKSYKRGPTLTHQLFSFFANCSNPFLYSLKLYANCNSNLSKSNSLAYAILEDLHNFKHTNDIRSDKYVDDNLRMVAFNFIKKQSQPNLYKIAVVTFDLMNSRHLFVEKIRELIREHHYKEASQLAYELELFHEFSLYELVLPLILQDKISIAEEYLTKAVHLRKPLVQLLDSFLNKSSSVSHNCSNIILKYNYPDVKFNKLQSKPLTKLIIRLAKLYYLPNDTIPNVIRSKNYGALQFLMHKKYGEKSLNKDSWEEMVKETVPADSISLQMELIDSCANNGDYAEGAFWARHFRIPAENLPTLVLDYIEQSKNQNSETTTSDNVDAEFDSSISNAKETAESIHLLSLELSQLHLVDNRTKFFAMLRTLVRENLVAFDAEWKPTFFSTNEVALIQLATRRQVFLVDVVQLDISHEDWNQLGRQIFNNMEILKLGFSPANDLTMFQKLIPGLNLSSLALTSYLDLQELWHRLHSMSQFKFPYELSEETGGTSLNNLVQLCVGRKLDKSNQFSNWEKRPLRQDQLTYAALDAYCLIEIHDVIEREFNRIEVDFNEFINTFLTERKGNRIVLKKSVLSANSQKKPATTVVQAVGPNPNSVGITNVKFICDIMLGGLSRALRKAGIDAISLTSNDNIDHYIQVAQRENRYFLTRGNFYVRCSKFLPPGHCYNVASDQRHEQLQEVLSYFNLTVTEANTFSRCIQCNGNEFLFVTQNEMSEMTRIPLTTPLRQSHDYFSNEQKARSWTLRKLTPYCKEKRITSNGVPIHVAVIRKETLNLYPSFYVCEGCGKCYWNGSHLKGAANYVRTKKR